MSRNLKKGLIITVFALICFITMICNGYFSDNVQTLIIVNAKLNSLKHIEEVIKEEVVDNNYDFFYESVSEQGIVISSFDSNKANLVLVNTMNKLKEISNDYNSSGEFVVNVPVTYLFIPSSYFLSDIKLKIETSNFLYYDVKLKTNIKEYGINSSLVELIMVVDIKYQIYAPLMVSVVDNCIEVPLAIELVNGKVPEGLFSY